MHAGQGVILLTPMKRNPPKSQLVTAEFPFLLHCVCDHITYMGLCWKPCPQKQGQTLLGSGGEDGTFHRFAKPRNKWGM